MPEQNISTIVHHNRHGKAVEVRQFSVPVTSAEGDSDALAMSQKGATDIADALRTSISEESAERQNVDNDLQGHKADPNAHNDIREDISSLNDTVGEHTTAISTLQQQIEDIIGDNTSVSLSASPNIVFAREETSITLTAKVNGATASAITIKKGSTVLATDSNKTQLTYADSNITPTADTSYSAEFVVNGKTKTANATVRAVNPIYYGAAATWEGVTNKASARTSPAGTYTISVGTDGHKVFFLVPTSMTIHTATMSGFNFPIRQTENVSKDGITYECYESEEMTVDTLVITLT